MGKPENSLMKLSADSFDYLLDPPARRVHRVISREQRNGGLH